MVDDVAGDLSRLHPPVDLALWDRQHSGGFTNVELHVSGPRESASTFHATKGPDFSRARDAREEAVLPSRPILPNRHAVSAHARPGGGPVAGAANAGAGQVPSVRVARPSATSTVRLRTSGRT